MSEKFWLESPSGARERLAGFSHKLLGQRLTAAEPTWEFQLDTRLFTYLTDHRIWDSVVFPAAGFVEIGLALIKELFPDEPHVIEEMQINKALFPSEENIPTVQVVFNEDDKTFRVYSSRQGGDWELNAQGRLIAFVSSQPTGLDLDQARLPLTDTVDHEKYCAEMREAGYEFGPNFQQVQNMWRTAGEAIGEIVVPEGVLDTLDDYQFHPAVLPASITAGQPARRTFHEL